jgi:hypothetical protein
MRHHAITELAESGASEQTVMSIAGHVSRKMLEHYSHIRVDAKRKALEALVGKRRASATDQGNKAHVTNRVTNQTLEGDVPPQVVDLNGGADETRTRDLLRKTNHPSTILTFIQRLRFHTSLLGRLAGLPGVFCNSCGRFAILTNAL